LYEKQSIKTNAISCASQNLKCLEMLTFFVTQWENRTLTTFPSPVQEHVVA